MENGALALKEQNAPFSIIFSNTYFEGVKRHYLKINTWPLPRNQAYRPSVSVFARGPRFKMTVLQSMPYYNSFLARGNFWRLPISFHNSLDPNFCLKLSDAISL